MWSLDVFVLLILIIRVQSDEYCSLNSEKCEQTHNKYSEGKFNYFSCDKLFFLTNLKKEN